MRGTLLSSLFWPSTSRFIPAYAGNAYHHQQREIE